MCLLLFAGLAGADTILLDTTTTLDDGSQYSVGTTYYATFQMDAGDSSDGSAYIVDITLGRGTPLEVSSNDPDGGIYVVSPDPADTLGIFQSNGMLALSLTPSVAFSVYGQQFTAGLQFGFDVQLYGTYSGGTPDSFSFQLYDSSLSTLLYEQDIAIVNTSMAGTPEPGPALLAGASMLLLLAAGIRRQKISEEK